MALSTFQCQVLTTQILTAICFGSAFGYILVTVDTYVTVQQIPVLVVAAGLRNSSTISSLAFLLLAVNPLQAVTVAGKEFQYLG